MKRFFYNIITLACLFFLCFSVAGYAQISEADKTEQEEVLKSNPRDFAANFIVGAYHYNMAIDPHAETSKMKLPEYIDAGEPFEKKKMAILQKALPYFENCYAITQDKDPRVKAVLLDIYKHLNMIRFSRVSPEQVEAQMKEKLAKIQFKAMN